MEPKYKVYDTSLILLPHASLRVCFPPFAMFDLDVSRAQSLASSVASYSCMEL
jgi:hypothetical protein